MNWETELIEIYFFVCAHAEELLMNCQRMSPNARPPFTDEELMAIYLYCTKEGYHKKKQMHRYVGKHLLSWFPQLPSYQAFNHRLNLLEAGFQSLANLLLPAFLPQGQQQGGHQPEEALIDSLPIMLSKGKKRGKVALEIADKGYCSTKNQYYHGIKLHYLGWVIPHRIPQPAAIIPSKASQNDATIFFQQIAPLFSNIVVYADRIYHQPAPIQQTKQQFNVQVIPVQKRRKGQPYLAADQLYLSTMVSQIRQPIESAFNQLIQLTDIQNASKCRSTKGTLLHIFAKIATAFYCAIFFNS